MSTSLVISYTLNPPSGATAPQGLPFSANQMFPIHLDNLERNGASDVSVKPDYRVYYAALRDAIAIAKDAVGEELTIWRDAVSAEESRKEKELGRGQSADNDDEEGEEADKIE